VSSLMSTVTVLGGWHIVCGISQCFLWFTEHFVLCKQSVRQLFQFV